MDTEKRLVVVGIDGSAESLAALRWALTEAVILDAFVDVVHCYLPQTLTDFSVGKPHELHTGSAIMLENEISTALAEMPESRPSSGDRPWSEARQRYCWKKPPMPLCWFSGCTDGPHCEI